MNTIAHEEITRRARSLWQERGCPAGRDIEIWLEAERQIGQAAPPDDDRKPNSFAERAKTETAAESVVEYQITPAGSEQEAIEAAMQKPVAVFRVKR